jgi:hypothetical protein
LLLTTFVMHAAGRSACSFGLSATSQQYFSLRTNQPRATSQQYFSLKTNQHQPSATSQTNRLGVRGDRGYDEDAGDGKRVPSWIYGLSC